MVGLACEVRERVKVRAYVNRRFALCLLNLYVGFLLTFDVIRPLCGFIQELLHYHQSAAHLCPFRCDGHVSWLSLVYANKVLSRALVNEADGWARHLWLQSGEAPHDSEISAWWLLAINKDTIEYISQREYID